MSGEQYLAIRDQRGRRPKAASWAAHMLAEWYGCDHRVIKRHGVERLLALDETTRRVLLAVGEMGRRLI
jgi:hypothetical protein